MSDTSTPPVSLQEFLEARLAEDHHEAQEAAQAAWVEDSPSSPWFSTYHPTASHPIVGVWPHRALADIAAKRAMIRYEPYGGDGNDAHMAHEEILILLASVYRDHPQWREEWA